MFKRFFLFLLIFILTCNYVVAANYSEDNAAYWYQKAFGDLKKIYESNDFSKSEDAKIINGLKSLEEFNKLSPDTKRIFESTLKSFLNDLKKAKSLKKIVFWKMPANDQDVDKTQFEDHKIIFRGFRMANALAWYAISIKKPELAGAIWQTMLSISINISEHNLIPLRTLIGGVTLRIVISSLENYFENGASDEFKLKFVEYLKKWPKSIFDIRNAIKEFYDYQKSNVELYANDQKFLATFFGANINCLLTDNPSTIKPVIEENQECARHLRIVGGALEMFKLDESEGNVDDIKPDFSSIENDKERRKVEMMWRQASYLRKKINNRDEYEEQFNEYKKNMENLKKNDDEDGFGSEFGDDNEERYKSAEDFIEKDRKKLKELESNLEKYSFPLPENKGPIDFSKLSWDEVISILEKTKYLRKDMNYSCPVKGKRILKEVKNGNEIGYDIKCDCGVVKNPMDDFKEDSKPMKLAKAYRETKFDSDKKQMCEYYEKLLKIDHSKPMSKEEMLALNSVEIPEYKNNVIIMWLGLGYDTLRKSFDGYQKLIDDFIKRYEKR